MTIENETLIEKTVDSAVEKSISTVGKHVVASAITVPIQSRKGNDKQIDDKAVGALQNIREGYINCFQTKDNLPPYLHIETRRAKFGFISLWWSNDFTQLENPDKQINDELEKEVIDNEWFYKYGNIALKSLHELLSAFKQSGLIYSSDYQESTVGAPTLITITIKDAILRFAKENKDSDAETAIVNLSRLSEFISGLQTQQSLWEHFRFKPVNSDRTLTVCVERVKIQLDLALSMLYRENQLKPLVPRLQKINQKLINMQEPWLEILSLLSPQDKVPEDFLIYVGQTEESLIPTEVNRFLKTQIGQFIANIHDKEKELQRLLHRCDQLIFLSAKGKSVNEELIKVTHKINQTLHDKYLLPSECQHYSSWFLHEDGVTKQKMIKPEVQNAVTQLCQAYMLIRVSLSIYGSVINVGQGYGELGLIERNENVSPYLSHMQDKLILIQHFINDIAPLVGDGIFTQLLRPYALASNQSGQHLEKQHSFRCRAYSVQQKIKLTIKPWLDNIIEQQKYIITALNSSEYYNHLKNKINHADELLGSGIFNAIITLSSEEFKQKIVETKDDGLLSEEAALGTQSLWAMPKVIGDLTPRGEKKPYTDKDCISQLIMFNNLYQATKREVADTKKLILNDVELDEKIKDFSSFFKGSTDWMHAQFDGDKAFNLIVNNNINESMRLKSALTRELFESLFESFKTLQKFRDEFKKIKAKAMGESYLSLRKQYDILIQQVDAKSLFSLHQDPLIIQLKTELSQEKNSAKALINENMDLRQQIVILGNENARLRLKIKHLEDFTKTLVKVLQVATQHYQRYINSLNFIQRLFSWYGEKGFKRAQQFEKRVQKYLSDSRYSDVIKEIRDFLERFETFGGNLNEHSYRTYILAELEKIRVNENSSTLLLFAPESKNWSYSKYTRTKYLNNVVAKIDEELVKPVQENNIRDYVVAN